MTSSSTERSVHPERDATKYTREPAYMNAYRYYVTDMHDDSLIGELQLTDVTYSSKVSAAGEFSGNIALAANNQGLDLYWATIPGKRALHIMRGGEAIWGGPIWSREYDAINRTINLQGASWESYLFKRTMWHTRIYTNTVDQYDVVRDMIHMMNTDFNTVYVDTDGVTPVSSNASVQIEVENKLAGKAQDTQIWLGTELRTFGQALTEFANNLNGFEWNINVVWDPVSQKFRRILIFRDTPPGQTPAGVDYTGQRVGLETNVFEFPGNIMSMSIAETADEAATRFFVVGGAPAGLETSDVLKPRGSWNNAEFLADGWPLLEVVESSQHSNVSKASTLRSYARVYGQRVKPPVPALTLTVNGDADPVIGSYEPGDWCRVVTTQDPFIMNKLLTQPSAPQVDPEQKGFTKRIMGYTVNVPTTPQFPETVTLELADEWISSSGDIGGGGGDGGGIDGDVPTAPTALTATAGDMKVRLDWADNPTAEAVTEYTVYSGIDTGSPLTTVTTSAALITGLTNGTAYTFTVRARNVAGTSPASASVVATPDAGAGKPPTVDSSLKVTFANTNFDAGHNKALITDICSYSDIILLCETKDFILNDYLPKGWVAYQNTKGRTKDDDPQDPSRAATCIGVKTSKVDFVEQGIELGIDTATTLPRYIKWITVKDKAHKKIRFISAAWPPDPTSNLYQKYTSSVIHLLSTVGATESICLGADGNQSHDTVASTLGLTSQGAGAILLGTKGATVASTKTHDEAGSSNVVVTIKMTAV